MALDDDYNEMLASLPKRGAKKRAANPETVLQKQIVEAIRAHGLWVVRVAGQGTLQHVGKGQAVLKQSEMAGFPDLLVLGPEGTAVWLEVKTPKGKVSPLQRSRIERLGILGHHAGVVRSVEQALAMLEHAGLVSRHDFEAV